MPARLRPSPAGAVIIGQPRPRAIAPHHATVSPTDSRANSQQLPPSALARYIARSAAPIRLSGCPRPGAEGDADARRDTSRLIVEIEAHAGDARTRRRAA